MPQYFLHHSKAQHSTGHQICGVPEVVDAMAEEESVLAGLPEVAEVIID
jgi:hypothetical protein